MGSIYAPLFVDFGQDIEILAALLVIVIVIGTAATIIPTRRRPPLSHTSDRSRVSNSYVGQ
jgi:hypothetical protein